MTFIKFGYFNITGRTGDLTNSEDKVLSIRKPQVRQKKFPAFFLWKPKVHYRIHNSPILVPVPSQKNLIHVVSVYFLKLFFYYIHLYLATQINFRSQIYF